MTLETLLQKAEILPVYTNRWADSLPPTLAYTPRNGTGDEARALTRAAKEHGADVAQAFLLGDADQPGSFYPVFCNLAEADTLAWRFKMQLWGGNWNGKSVDCLDLLRDYRTYPAAYSHVETPRGRTVKIVRQLENGQVRYRDCHGLWAATLDALLRRSDESYYAPAAGGDNWLANSSKYAYACGYFD